MYLPEARDKDFPGNVTRLRHNFRLMLRSLIRLSKETAVAKNTGLRRGIADLTEALTRINVIFAKKLALGTDDDELFRENMNVLIEELRAFWQSRIMDMDGGRRRSRQSRRQSLRRNRKNSTRRVV